MSPDMETYYLARTEILAREIGTRDYLLGLLIAAGDDLIGHKADPASQSWWAEAKREAERKIHSRIPSSTQANDGARP